MLKVTETKNSIVSDEDYSIKLISTEINYLFIGPSDMIYVDWFPLINNQGGFSHLGNSFTKNTKEL